MSFTDLPLVWLDLEMTGLDPERDVIVEVGALLSGPDLAPIERVERVVWHPDDVLARMEPFVREMHTRSGLIDRIRSSRCSLREAERDVVTVLARHCQVGQGVLAGNSIHTDRSFVRAHMPMLDRFLGYRQLDVSSIKLLAKGWYPHLPPLQKPEANHTVMADIEASMRELAHYRDTLFRSPADVIASQQAEARRPAVPAQPPDFPGAAKR